jgi:DNA-binding NarL/FixJ family response regulator
MPEVGRRIMTSPIRVMLVDDQALFRESMTARLEREDDLQVVATAPDAREGLEAIGRCEPDVVLLDIRMPGMSCFDAAERMRLLIPRLHVAFLSGYWNDQYIDQALAAGAAGYLTKSQSSDEVVEAVRGIARGERRYSREVQARLVFDQAQPRLPHAAQSRLSRLTPREKQVLRCISEGLSKREIAKVMHISPKTVAAHSTNLMMKLDIHDRVELARFAIREGLLQP